MHPHGSCEASRLSGKPGQITAVTGEGDEVVSTDGGVNNFMGDGIKKRRPPVSRKS